MPSQASVQYGTYNISLKLRCCGPYRINSGLTINWTESSAQLSHGKVFLSWLSLINLPFDGFHF